MRADAVSVIGIFEKKMRLEVPLFQRQYVWGMEEQWRPLWEDIVRKFTEQIEGRDNAPVHFLGAMVLDQKQTPITHVERRQIIDGQQRLTTLQIFMAAFRDFCRKQGCNELSEECEMLTLNKGMLADPEVDKYKVWPTLLDRDQFKDVINSRSREALEAKHPLTYLKNRKKPERRPKMIEAYAFFYDELTQFFLGTEGEKPIGVDQTLEHRLEISFQALRNSLQVVAIDLGKEDDPQVIFETLNARGQPLLPADLVRNYIFLRASRSGESPDNLYDEYWRRFDEEYWRVEVSQGRLLRPRSDLFMQHFLASRQTVDIPIKHLFSEYKFWIERHKPFANVTEELSTLARQGDDFRRILSPAKEDVLRQLSMSLEAFDVRTAYPLLLALLDAKIGKEEWDVISETIESFIVRRAVCNLTTKNYNGVFLSLTKNLRQNGISAENLRRQMASLSGASAEWPSDVAFKEAWLSAPMYERLNNSKLVHVLKRLNDTFGSNKTETISIEGPLSVEHVLPKQWIKHWTLPDGTTGMEMEELANANLSEQRAVATRRRNALLQTLGNLTILTQPLNSAVSNSDWKTKKPEMLRYSLLPINQWFFNVEKWDEEHLELRSKDLFMRAIQVWPRPDTA